MDISIVLSGDDPNLLGHQRLWRRIHPSWYVPDLEAGERKVTSQAYQNGKTAEGLPANHMSVTLADRQDAPKSPAEAVSGKYDGYGLVQFSIASARALGQGVSHTPTPDEPAHGSVTGKKTKSVMNGFKERAELLIEPRVQTTK